MTAKEAYKKLISRYSAVKVAKCYEYDSLFTFQMNPTMLSLSKTKYPMIDSLLSVNKTTGEIRDFKPFHVSVEEYRRGKEVPETDYKR